MILLDLIDRRSRERRSFEASLHDKQLRSDAGDDGHGLVRGARISHIERMKQRRRGSGC